MAPHKRNLISYIDKPLVDVQADHEMFLQAFEKPTQIYRYLRTRNALSVEKNEQQSSHPGSFLNLSFIGYFDKRIAGEGDLARLQVHVVKMCHKKRKESSTPLTQVCVGNQDVVINPCIDSSFMDRVSVPVDESPITIPTQTFGNTNGHQIKSFLLVFKVELVHDQENVGEPATKRRRLSRGGSFVATANADTNEIMAESAVTGAPVRNNQTYKAELVVYDRHGRCQLTPGVYDLLLHPVSAGGGRSVGSSPRKSANWESAEDLKVETANFSNFCSTGPTLQFKLYWTHHAEGGINGRINSENSLSAPQKPVVRPKQPLSVILANTSATKPKQQDVCSPEAPQLVLYQFIYNNNSRQQTEARRDFHCPWCAINCLALYCLLKHLKLCHARFTFTYVPHPKGARIDVALNDCYDGSYAGNPQDLVLLSDNSGGALFSRAGPAQRPPITAILVCRPRRSKPSLSEFLEQDHADFDLPRSYILGHNRLYHHTMTCRPIGAHELDEDSEGEHDSHWMRVKTVSMIDDFSDVNEGEKHIMKLWNVHCMKHNFVGDIQLTKACSMFVEVHGKELLRRNLYRNFVLHLVSLYDFGVIGAGAVYSVIRQLQDILKDDEQVRESLLDSWEIQRRSAPRVPASPHCFKASPSKLEVSSTARNFFATDTHSLGCKSPEVAKMTKPQHGVKTLSSVHNGALAQHNKSNDTIACSNSVSSKTAHTNYSSSILNSLRILKHETESKQSRMQSSNGVPKSSLSSKSQVATSTAPSSTKPGSMIRTEARAVGAGSSATRSSAVTGTLRSVPNKHETGKTSNATFSSANTITKTLTLSSKQLPTISRLSTGSVMSSKCSKLANGTSRPISASQRATALSEALPVSKLPLSKAKSLSSRSSTTRASL